MKKHLKWIAVSAVMFLLGGVVGGVVASWQLNRFYLGLGETEVVGTVSIRLHTAALLRLDRHEEARGFLESLTLMGLPYMMNTYPDPATMPYDSQRSLSILRRYHEMFPIAGLEGEMAAWVGAVPLLPLAEDCPAPLLELLAEE